MKKNGKLNYVEFASNDLALTKDFFSRVFGWHFIDYGSEYTAFSDAGLDGGFFKSNLSCKTANGAGYIDILQF